MALYTHSNTYLLTVGPFSSGKRDEKPPQEGEDRKEMDISDVRPLKWLPPPPPNNFGVAVDQQPLNLTKGCDFQDMKLQNRGKRS